MGNNHLKQKLTTIFLWLKDRMRKTSQRDTKSWRLLVLSMWLATISTVVVITIANPTGLGFLIDFSIYVLLNSLLFLLVMIACAFLLSLMYIPLPRLFTGSLLYTGGLVYYVLTSANLETLFITIITASFCIVSILFGILIIILLNKHLSLWIKSLSVLLPAIALFVVYHLPVLDQSEVPSFSEAYGEVSVTPLNADINPANAGPYPYQYFTYGSGEDKHRKEYGKEVGLISNSINAAEYVESDDWTWKRKLFWGFDEKELPLNGRVWLPKGEGPFPIVMITHGNHKMEYFSDAGYGYLGELLASRGFITVSIDQNFVNYSNWSGIPDKDMELRAWLMLHHLLQIEEFSETEANPFFEKVDFNNIALIGHSRGGLAAAMAADYQTWFSEDVTLEGVEHFGIESVIGIAPTDRRVDKKVPNLRDINYMVIHGAQDADVNSFRGDRQYGRTTFSKGSSKFKTSLYLAQANHSYFNTDWGTKDSSLPAGLFLNHRDTMKAEQQREIAKVYVSAFLETTLHGNNDYEKLFHDYQYGLHWLPKTVYFNRFENGLFDPINNFQVNKDKTQFGKGITVEGNGFTTWEVENAKDRRKYNKGNPAVILEWRDESYYSISLSEKYRNDLTASPDSFIVSVANMGRDLEDEIDLNPKIEVEFKNEAGDSVLLPLDDTMPVPAQIKTQYTILPWFDEIMKDGKYEEAEEPVFHMYEIQLESLNHLTFENISEIVLHFTNGPGKIMIDDIGYISYN